MRLFYAVMSLLFGMCVIYNAIIGQDIGFAFTSSLLCRVLHNQEKINENNQNQKP